MIRDYGIQRGNVIYIFILLTQKSCLTAICFFFFIIIIKPIQKNIDPSKWTQLNSIDRDQTAQNATRRLIRFSTFCLKYRNFCKKDNA